MAEITYSKPTWANGGVPAISASNLQALSDAVDKLAHAANRAGALLDADTVSGYGIGVTATTLNSPIDIDTIYKGGLYYAYLGAGTKTHFPYASGTEASCILIVSSEAAASIVQKCIFYYGLGKLSEEWTRSSTGSTWTAWAKVWTSLSDGNGGQPPVGKALTDVTSRALNAYTAVTLVNGGYYLITGWNATSGGAASAIVQVGGSQATLMTTLGTNANISIVIPGGLDVRITNLNAGASNIWSTVVLLGKV